MVPTRRGANADPRRAPATARRAATSRRGGIIATGIAAALVAASCGSAGPVAELEPVGSGPAASSAADASAALALLSREDDELVIENTAPVLLGFDPPDAPPSILAMDDADERSSDASLESTDVDPATTGPVGDTATADDADTADGGTADDRAGDGASPESGTSESGTSESGEVVLPDPPSAAPGPDALYDDPTELLVAASGRPFGVISPTAGATTRGVTDRVIHVGAVVSATLAGAPFRGDACLGAEARYLQAEVHDELTRRIVLDACIDDAARADLSAGVARSLVDDGAFAIAPIASPAFLADEALGDDHVVYIGDEALPGFCGRHAPFGFGTAGARGCPVLDARGYAVLSQPVLTALDAAFDDGLPADIMVLAESGPDGAAVLASRRLEAELASLPIPVAGPALPDAGDGPPASWAAIADAVIDADPGMVLIEGEVTDGLPTALHRRGFTGEVVLVGAVDPLDVADPEIRSGMASLTVVSPGIDVADRSTDGWQALEGAAAAVGVAADEIGLDFVQGYIAADMLVQGLAATPEPLTAERLVHTMNDGWWYPGIDGLACGSWWPASRYVPAPCVSVARVDPAVPVLVPVVDLVETAPQLRFHLD